MIEVPPDEFAQLVGEALDSIPPELGRVMSNVAVLIDDDSPPGNLFGLYEGIPLTERVDYGGMAMPDTITIFRQTICAVCVTRAEVVDQVRTTVLHEVGHHFGIAEKRLHELGWD